MTATRIAATSAALDAAQWPSDAIVLRTAPDEAIVLAAIASSLIADAHAIVEPETALFGVWMPIDEALALLERECDWELPVARPAFAQGAVAGLPLKLWFERDRVLFVVSAPFATDFAERLR
ncbi:MAG: hypothetical protein WCQ64_07830 [Acidobacteriota bacterium]